MASTSLAGRSNRQSQWSRIKARERYESGYRKALELADGTFNWESVDRLAEANWDIKRWIENLRTLGDAGRDYEALNETFYPIREAIWADHKLVHAYWPNETGRLGFLNALRDLWTSVREGQQPDGALNAASSNGKEERQ